MAAGKKRKFSYEKCWQINAAKEKGEDPSVTYIWHMIDWFMDKPSDQGSATSMNSTLTNINFVGFCDESSRLRFFFEVEQPIQWKLAVHLYERTQCLLYFSCSVHARSRAVIRFAIIHQVTTFSYHHNDYVSVVFLFLRHLAMSVWIAPLAKFLVFWPWLL